MKISKIEKIEENNRFYFRGNGIYEEPTIGCFFYVDENAEYKNENILIEEAFVNFINIAEFINPLVYVCRLSQEEERVKKRIRDNGRTETDVNSLEPLDLLKVYGFSTSGPLGLLTTYSIQENRKVKLELVSVVSDFIDSYGFVHRKKNSDILAHDSLKFDKSLEFIDEPFRKRNMEGVTRSLNEEFRSICNLLDSEHPLWDKSELESRKESLSNATCSSYYMDKELKRYVKCYKDMPVYTKRHLEEAEQFRKIHDNYEYASAYLKYQENDDLKSKLEAEYKKQLEHIHPDDYEDVEKACQKATIELQPYLKSIEKYGLLTLTEPWYYFECAALLLDGFYLYLASIGDNEALDRIKVFFHIYDFQPVDGDENDIIKVISFESLYHDRLNPYQCGYENKVIYRESEYVPCKDTPWHWFDCKTDIAYEVCEPSEFSLTVDQLIEKHIKGLAEKFIDHQCIKNYKNRYFDGMEVHSIKDVYSPASNDIDLCNTFWNFLQYMLKNNIQTEIIYCERCRRIKIVKRKGRAKNCDDPNCKVRKSRGDFRHTYQKEWDLYREYLTTHLPELLSKKSRQDNEDDEDVKDPDFNAIDYQSRSPFHLIKKFFQRGQ